jgi:hypothetical protein
MSIQDTTKYTNNRGSKKEKDLLNAKRRKKKTASKN